MPTIIRRDQRRTAALLAGALLVIVLALALAWVFMAIWLRGGPQPLHPIVIAIPAPQMPASAASPA